MAFLWISPASVLQWFFPRGLLFHIHFYNLEVSPGQNRRISCFCLGILICLETTKMLPGEEGYPLAPIPKSDSLGVLRGWFWCVDFLDDLCFCCTLDVLRMSDLLCRTKHTQLLPRYIKPMRCTLHWSLQKYFCQENPSILVGPEVTFPGVPKI